MSKQDTTVADDATDTSTDGDLTAADFENDADNASWNDGEQAAETESEDDSSADEADKEETTKPEGDESESSDTAEEETTEDGSEEHEDKSEDAEKTETDLEAERKKHNDEMAKARIAERKAKEDAEKARKEAEDVSIERYLAEAGDDEIEKQRRELAVEAYRVKEEKTANNHDRLQAGIERAVATIPLFQTKDKAVQEELAGSLDAFEAMFVVKDKGGRPEQIKVDPKTGKPADVYAYLQAKADSIQRLTGLGAKQQEKQKTSAKARTMTAPVKAPKTGKKDPGLEGFEEEANRW